MQIVAEACSRAKFLCQTNAQRAIFQVGSVQLELAIAIDDFVDVRQLREVVVDTFHRHHRLMTFIDGERHFFYRLRCHINLR